MCENAFECFFGQKEIRETKCYRSDGSGGAVEALPDQLKAKNNLPTITGTILHQEQFQFN